jgi:hypothetical protein
MEPLAGGWEWDTADGGEQEERSELTLLMARMTPNENSHDVIMTT